MDGGGEMMMPAPAWSLFHGYFSPATLFLLLNVVIGTIVLTSRSHRHHSDDDEHRQPAPQQQQQQQDCNDVQCAPPASLARTSSVMERLRSLGLYRFRSGDFPPEYNYNHHSLSTTGDESSRQQQQDHCARKIQSEPSARPPVDKTGNKASKAKKSSSELKRQLVQRAPRAPATVREEAAAARCVDARADDFINKFRQQLQLQRLNSLINYKEMLNRGTT